MTELKPRVFVIDDDASILKSLSRLLSSSGLEAEIFESAEQFLERKRYEGVGCIVLDVKMPGLSGTALQELLNETGLSMPVIFITGHGDIAMSVRAMKKGAVDFLTKPFDDELLLEAVKKAIETDWKAKAERMETGVFLHRLGQLTPRELEVLRYVISGMPNKMIAVKLKIAEKTIKTHRGHIMKKLAAGSVADLVRAASRAGIEPLSGSL
jgi:FixJ family two-component response regulator